MTPQKPRRVVVTRSKTRRVVITIEADTGVPLKMLSNAKLVRLYVQPFEGALFQFIEVLQASANVIRAGKKGGR